MVCLLMLCLLFVCLTGCANKAPSEKQLETIIPQEIIECTFQGETFEGKIEKLHIARQRTEESDDYSDCEVVLKYPFGTRTVFVSLHSIYWDKGSWMLNNWETYEQEEIEITETIDDEMILGQIESRGYTSDGVQGDITFIGAEEEKTEGVRWYDITYTSANLDAWGTVYADYRLASSDFYPKEYWWSVNVDSSEVDHEWHIYGEWQGAIYTYSQYRGELFFTVDDLMQSYYTDTGEDFYWVEGYIDYMDSVATYNYDWAYSDDLEEWWQIEFFEEGDCPNNWCISTDTYRNGDVPIKYYPDRAMCAEKCPYMFGAKSVAGDWNEMECTQRY